MMRRVRLDHRPGGAVRPALLAGAVMLRRSQAAASRSDEVTALKSAAGAEAQRYFGEARKRITSSARSSDFLRARDPPGIATVDETREVLSALAVEEVTERVAVMAGATERIADRLMGIAGGMDQATELAQQASAAAQEMSAWTEETSATSQQLAAPAQDLSNTAAALERAVDWFTLTAS